METGTTKSKIIIIALIGVFFVLMFYRQWQTEESLNSNTKMTIGKITNVHYNGGKGHIEFKFYVDGVLYETDDPDNSGWPDYVRERKAERYQFYPVEYDVTNPNNSKIIITEKPFSYQQLLKRGIPIKGEVEKIYVLSESYADLYITYHYLKGDFKFRTRLHMDSLPCGTFDSCKQKDIMLTVSKFYPAANNLYIKSYDRVSRRKAEERRKSR